MIRARGAIAFCVSILWLASPALAKGPAGLWPMPRHDAGNTGHADVSGSFTSPPVEVWRCGLSRRDYGYVRPVSVGGSPAYLRQSGATVQVIRPDGRVLWSSQNLDVVQFVAVIRFAGRQSPEEALAAAGDHGYTLFNIANGGVLWRWTPPRAEGQGGFRFLPQRSGGRLFAFPQDTTEGYCFEFTRPGKPRLLWHAEYKDKYWANFGPYIVLADMRKRGKPDILLAGKPCYFAVINIDTGAIEFDLHYNIPGHPDVGRPYGLLEAVDIDGDGYPDAVMISHQVEKYIGIARNVGGKAFKLEWAHGFEESPSDNFTLRPNVTSVVDLNGDGKREIVLGIYDAAGDKRWHTMVLNGFGGLKDRLADLPDRYFWGCYDLSGSGHPDIVTSVEHNRLPSQVTTLKIVDGRTFRDVATIAGVEIVPSGQDLPPNEGYYAYRETPLFPLMPDGERGLVLRRPSEGGSLVLMRLRDGKPVMKPFRSTNLALTVMSSSAPGSPLQPDLRIAEPPATSTIGAYSPLVCSNMGQRELVVARTDLTTVGGVPDLRHSGKWRSQWQVQGTCPTIWQAPDGSRRVCTLDGTKSVAYVYDPHTAPGAADTSTPPQTAIPLPYPPFLLPGMTMPYGDRRMRLFVDMQSGIHNLACGVWDEDGQRVWYDPMEGPYPRQAAAFKDDGRWSIFMDNHGKDMLYNEAGEKRVVAHGWYTDVPGRGNGSKYALPIAGPYGPGGATRIVLSPGLEQMEILDASGARVAMASLGGIYVRDSCTSAVGRPGGQDGGWDVASIAHDGILHCTSVSTAEDRWTLDLGVKSEAAYHIIAANLEGSGRDDFLVAMPNGDLDCVGERRGKGVLLWRKSFDAGLTDVIAADLEGDGHPDIIVSADDDTVRILKPGSGPRAESAQR